METAIIIGASTGIGRAAALALSETCTGIAITSLKHTAELMSLKSRIEANGCKCICMSGDAGDMNFIQSFIKQAADSFNGHIDLLLNNAGISYVGLLTDMTIYDFDNIMRTNVYSVFNACNQVVPYMVHEKHGKIINVSSVWGNVGASCEVAYSASKGAVGAFTKALAKELAPSGICVNAIAFGAIDTAMNSHLLPDERIALEEEIPAGRMGTADEAAEFICRLAECGDYLNGQVISFDGAWQ